MKQSSATQNEAFASSTSGILCGLNVNGGGGSNPPPPPPPPPPPSGGGGGNPNNNGRPIVATWYCSLTDSSKGSCFPGSCGTYSAAVGGYGIAALNPSDFDGGSVCQYKGSACGQCWKLSGPGGVANIQVTDCCAGYPGNPSCLSSTDPLCDWCADNNNQHFDLDWDSYSTVCGGQANAGHCILNSAQLIACGSQAVAEAATNFTNSSAVTAAGTPMWAVAMIGLASIVIVLLVVTIILLALRKNREERS